MTATSAISFDRPDAPRASLVVLGWKAAPHLMDCLRSIASNVKHVDYEVIVALNAPTGGLRDALESTVRGATVVVSAANRGFSGGCNMGAKRARGEYVVLLNDDTIVEPGWLEALVDTADRNAHAGAVGGTVVNPDGSLQEAGALIWSDGSAAAVGDSVLPADMPLLQTVRRVDYCGGEALLVRRTTWEAVGGLSDDYYPAYYEDADLCLKIAARGEVVLFQPAARIQHVRGHSTNDRFRTFLVGRSRNVFVERWAGVLAARPGPDPSNPDAVQAAIAMAAQRPAEPNGDPAGPAFAATDEEAPDDEQAWFARERALWEEYVEHLESTEGGTAEGEVAPAETSKPSRYTADIDLLNVNNPHVLAIGRVPANSRVLDLGAADGSVAAVLKGTGCRVWGVEIDPAAAEAARQSCEDVAVADLNTVDLAELFGRQRFDVVLMLDVLEHLPDPVGVLRRVSSVLEDGGWGVISLPNVAHVSVRVALLRGRFTYTDVGLLDRTHLRFFDRSGVDDLLLEAGWGMFDLDRVVRPYGQTEIPAEDVDPALLAEVLADPEALTYQFLVTAAPIGSAVLDHPPPLPAAAAQHAFKEAASRSEAARAEYESAVAASNTRNDILEAETGALRDRIQALDGELARMRDTKLFRWSSPARRSYARLRGLGRPRP